MRKIKGLVHNRYLVKMFRGRGGAGRSFLAEDRRTGRPVVLKLFDLANLRNRKALKELEQEAAALKALDHPLIPDFPDAFRLDGGRHPAFVLVQEYIEGTTLRELIAQGKRFSPEEMRDILAGLLEVLDCLHRRNPAVIHRDVNPENIIIGADGRPHLVGFGAVGNPRRDALAAARPEPFMGAAGFRPPEQLQGKALPSSDLFALGITMAYLAAGSEPAGLDFDGERINIQNLAGLPPALAPLIERMTEPDVRNRLPTARTALDLLEGKAEAGPPPAPADSRIKVKMERGETRLFLPNAGVLGPILYWQGVLLLSYAVFGITASLIDPDPARRLENLLSGAVWVVVSGVVPVLYRIFFKTRKRLSLVPGKIILLNTYFNVITRAAELKAEDFRGFESLPNGRMKGRPVYHCRIVGTVREFGLGRYFFQDETELLQKTILTHVGETQDV